MNSVLRLYLLVETQSYSEMTHPRRKVTDRWCYGNEQNLSYRNL
ncbi:hypothetical protein ACHAW6_013317 [Cyclotella cf. meneghiniana]